MFRNPLVLTLWIFAVSLTLLGGCGLLEDDAPFADRKSVRPFVLNQPQFNVRVRYETGAEPFVGWLSTGTAVWSVTEMNLKLNLPSWVSQVNVPFNLQQMTQVHSSRRASWTKSQLEDLAFETRFAQEGLSSNTITVYYLNGFYQQNPIAMGLHFHGSSVVFIFKQIVRDLGGTNDSLAYAEQSAVVHEIGHAFGLVNGYVAMSSHSHEDPSSVSHCTNPNCVMYKKNDGVQGYQRFRSNSFSGQNQLMNLFGQECSLDLQNFYRQGQTR